MGITRNSDPKNGKLITNFKNGKVMLEAEFKDGKKHGPFTLSYESGQKMLSGNWSEGMPEGKTTTWYENGQIKQEIELLKGLPHGTWRSWHENGQPKEEGSYLFGDRIGLWREWDSQGILLKDEVYGGQKRIQSLWLSDDQYPINSKFFLRRFFRHPFFLRLLFFTGAYMSICSVLLYFAESSANPQVTSFLDAVRWVTSTIPFIGRAMIQPATTSGMVVAIVGHFCGFFAFCFWAALVGWSLFSQSAIKIALTQAERRTVTDQNLDS